MQKGLFLIILFNTALLFSQSKVDSLYLELDNAKTDSIQLVILHHIYQEFKYEFPERAQKITKKAISIAIKTDSDYLKAKVYNLKADYLQTQSKYDSAILVFQDALKFSKKAAFNSGISEALVGLGNTYLRKGNFEKALEYQRLNLQKSQSLNDQESTASSYNNIGNIYNEIGEYTKAMENYTMASEEYQQLGNLKNFSITLANIGMIESKLENFETAKDYLIKSDSIFSKIDFQPGRAFVLKTLAIISKEKGNSNESIQYNFKAISSYEKMGSKHEIGQILNTLGNTYYENENYNEAMNYYEKALNITQQIGDSAGIAIAYKSLGICHFQKKNIKEAKLYSQYAINVANKQGTPLTIMTAYETLSKAFAKEGNYEKAFEYMNQFTILKDSLYTQQKRELALDIEGKYQNKQKVKEIELLGSENNLKALQIKQRVNERNAIIAFAIILLLLGGLLFNQYRLKQKANIKLKELDKLKSNFFANISHEFRTPLTLIKGPIELLIQNPDESLSKENAKMISRNTNRLLRLVNQLLDLSKVDEGSLKLEPTEGDVFKCLKTVASTFNSHAAQRHIDYRVSIPYIRVWSSFDRDKLEKINYNLLGNAFKFSDDGAVISFDVKYEKNLLTIQVSDTGTGIPIDKQPFIFDRFYQADSSITREEEGSGIGLSLTKSLVELMEGTITVSSELKKGSFFTVQIPLLEIQTRTKKEEIDTDKHYKFNYKLPSFDLKKTDNRNLPVVLLVEDNEDMRSFINQHLILHYRVEESLNGEDGLQKAIHTTPDLIITDLMMPKIDGIELTKKLKLNINTSHIPVIMLTAKAGMDNKIEGLETGADDYLIKPFDVSELLVRVKNLIQQRQNLRELYSKSNLNIDPKKITVTSVDQKFLEEVLKLLEEKYADSEFGVPQMQKTLVMSKTQMHRKLKALTNETPGELLRNFRLKRAAQLISQDAENITQIAYEVGFNSLSYFAKCFKELYGVAPSSYTLNSNN